MTRKIKRKNKKMATNTLKKAELKVPTYYLSGKEAEELDRLVEEGLKDYREGRTRKIKSLADLNQ